MTKQDISENQVNIVYLGIGSNLGNKQNNLDRAKFELQSYDLKIHKISSIYETESWPNPNKPKFLNIVIKIKTSLSPFNLLRICNIIESNLGRKRDVKNAPRTCDIDILDYNQKVLNYNENLILPHPGISKRNFVLLPLYEISKSWTHPKSKLKISELINLLEIKNLRSIKQV